MKKKILLAMIAIVALVTLVGCGSKEDSNSIIGTWKHESTDYTYKFNKDKTGSYSYGNQEMKFTYEDSGTDVSILYDGNTMASTYDYKIDGKKLIIKDSLGSDVIYIRK